MDMDSLVFVLIFTFIFLPVIFCILFIIFLVRSVKLGKRVKELERELLNVKYGNPDSAKMMPQQGMNYSQVPSTYVQRPEIQPQSYVPQQPVSAPVQPFAPQPATVQPQSAAVQPQPVQQTQTPSWAVPPAQVQMQRASAPVVTTQPAPKKKVFSSINITFGIGVLLLTIVGATFMTVS